MNIDFEKKMQLVIDGLDPKNDHQILQQVEYLHSNGLYSFESLLTIVQAQQTDADLRVTVCWLLGQLGDKRAADALVGALNESDAKTVQEAAKSLGIIKSKKAVSPLIAILLQSKDSKKREAAAYALGRLHDKRAYEALLQTLVNPHETPKVRGFSAEALASLRDKRASSLLIAALEDSSIEVRFWSAFALGELKERRAIPILERLVANDRSVLPDFGPVSEEAANAINKIRKNPPPNHTAH